MAVMQIEEHVPLGPLTTFRIGGPARFFARATSLESLQEALAFAEEKKLPVLLLGGGSNLLIDDRGFDGLVVKIETKGVAIERTDGGATLIAEAGESWDALVSRVVDEGLWGVENLSGIPGTVGAAPVQNIGAYGAELKHTLAWAEAFDVSAKKIVRLSPQECAFGYRTSMFKHAPGKFCIMRVAFSLMTAGTPNISYRDLQEAFKDVPSPSLAQIRQAVLAIRARKFPDLSQEGTAGSFFLNPAVSISTAAALRERFPELPQFPAEEGVKISLAWLLDHGLSLRGTSVGGARLFERQPLVIAARRGASSRDVRALAAVVIERIQKEFAIHVEPEVRMIQNNFYF